MSKQILILCYHIYSKASENISLHEIYATQYGGFGFFSEPTIMKLGKSFHLYRLDKSFQPLEQLLEKLKKRVNTEGILKEVFESLIKMFPNSGDYIEESTTNPIFYDFIVSEKYIL